MNKKTIRGKDYEITMSPMSPEDIKKLTEKTDLVGIEGLTMDVSFEWSETGDKMQGSSIGAMEAVEVARPSNEPPMQATKAERNRPMIRNKLDKSKMVTHPLGIPGGFSSQFHFKPQSMIEYTIAIKGAADLFQQMDYVNAGPRNYLQVGLMEHQECLANGAAVKNIDGHLTSVVLSTNPDNGIFSASFHSYNEDAMQKMASEFHRVCSEGNFYRGKHLKAMDFDCPQPLVFLSPPANPLIYGFKEEQDAINMHAVRYFECEEIHKIAPQRGVLLYGRPGSGKSLLVSKTKYECLQKGITVVEASIEGMREIGKWFALIEAWLAPALVVLEDVDLIGGDRDIPELPHQLTTDLLSSLGGNTRRINPIVTIATTNRLDSLDNAFLRARRMDKVMEINGLQPDFKAELFRRHGMKVTEQALQAAVTQLGPDTTGADVEEISVSTLTYSHFGMPHEEAFTKSLGEWAKGHSAKANLGFNKKQQD